MYHPTLCINLPHLPLGVTNDCAYHFSTTIHLRLAGFMRQNTYKKNQQGEMLMEQIIQFQLKGPGLFRSTCAVQRLFP